MSTGAIVAVPYASARDRLRAADGERARHAGKMRSGEHQRIARSAGRRNDHHDFADARDVRRDRAHQHRRRVARPCLPARRCRRGRARSPAARIRCRRHRDTTTTRASAARGTRANARCGGLQGAAHLLRQRSEGGAHRRRRDFERGHRASPRRRRIWRVYSMSAASPRSRTSATIRATVASTAGSCAASERRERGELALEARRGRIEAAHHEHFVARGIRGGALCLPMACWRPCGRHRLRHRFEQRLHELALQLERGRIDDEPRADRNDVLDDDEIVGGERAPELTRSTIASARPDSGASSIEPYSLIRSTCTPLAAKCSRARLARTWWRRECARARWTVPVQSKPRLVATTMRQRARSRDRAADTGLRRPAPAARPCPLTPMSAAPCAT